MIPGLCRIWFRRRNPDPTDMWGKCWQDMSYAPRGYTDCEQLIEHYEEEWGNHYEYCIRTAAWGGAPKPTMPGAPA